MGGISIPITFNQGRQRAHLDNQADQQFDQETQVRDRQIQGLDLGLQKGRMELGEAQKNLPLNQMKRDAATIAEIAKFGIANMSRVADADKPAFLAQLFTDMPAFGNVEVRGGGLFDGSRELSVQDAEKWLMAMADPETAMKLKQDELAPRQYVVDGQVVTMTPQQAAKVPGARRFDDVSSGVSLGKSFADVDNTKAQAAERRAQAGKHSAEAQWVGPKAQADIGATNALAAERRASANEKTGNAGDKQRKAIREELEFLTKQVKESGSNTYAFLGNVESVDGLDVGQRQSVAARMDQIQRDPGANAKERQIAARYVALMQAGGYLDSDDELAAAESAKAEYAKLVKQFGRERARAIIAQRDSGSVDPRNIR